MSHSSRTRFLCWFREEQFGEIRLPLAGHLRRLVDRGVPVRVADGRLLDLEQVKVHRLLCGHVPTGALGLDEPSMLAEPGEQAPWADVDAVAFQDLREIAHKDGRPRGFDRVGEQDLAFLGL